MQTERQAIAQLKNGEIAGLEFLVKTYQVNAVQAAYLILRDRSTAEEIVQTAYLNLIQKIEQFDERRPFGPWFLRSVIHAALKTTQRQARLVSLEADEPDTERSWADLLVDERPGPEVWLETEQTSQEIWEALGRLDPEQRAAIVLHYFLEMREAEIASELKRPRSAIKWWLRAGLIRVAESLIDLTPPGTQP